MKKYKTINTFKNVKKREISLQNDRSENQKKRVSVARYIFPKIRWSGF